MKKFVALFLAVLTITANAEWKTICTAQLADNVSLAVGLSKLGEFTGNAMLGMMAAGMLKDLPCAEAFGPGRKGAATLYPFFVENGRYEFAILYPVAIKKAAFMKKYPDAVESNGLIRVTCPLLGKDPTVCYVAFSKDGKWAGASDVPQQARLALTEIPAAEKSLDGDMIKVHFLKEGIRELAKSGEQMDKVDVRKCDFLNNVDGMILGVRVSSKGLDFRGAIKPSAGSEFAKIGQQPLAADALSFAAGDSVFASASGANCGQDSPAKVWKELKPLIEKAGFKLDWLEFVEKNVNTKFTVDCGRFLAYLKTLSENEKDETDEKSLEALKDYFEKRNQNETFKAVGPAFNFEFALKGYASKFMPAQRFRYTLPEVADKRPFAVGFFSLYSLLRTVLPHLSKADPEAFKGYEAVFAALPEEGQGGMAFMAWSDKNTIRYFFRIGADEFKAVSAGFAAFAAMASGGDSGDSEDDGNVD